MDVHAHADSQFCGSDRGGSVAAIYGIIVTAKMNGVGPQA
jgi:transposase